MLRHLPFGTMLNLRDLGGYALPGGGATEWGRLLRGDTPNGLSEAEIAWLLGREITTIIDMRSEAEVSRRPNQLAGLPGFTYFHCPMVSGETLPNMEADVGLGYFEMLSEEKNACRVLRRIADAPGGALFHCTAGKDRTGVIAALILSLCGVSRIDILVDYQVSEIYIMEMAELIRTRWPESPAFWGQSRREYLEGCFGHLERRYGSVAGYLQAAGLTGDEISRVRAKLAPK